MLNMSFSRLINYYIASFSLPYIIEDESDTKKEGLWTLTETKK